MRQDIKKIRNLLKEYSKLKRDLTAFNQVSSPSFDGVPSHSSRNDAESRLINHVDLSYQLKEVEDALNAIDDLRYQFILNEYIINKRFTRNEVCERLSVSISNFNCLKNKALRIFQEKYFVRGKFNWKHCPFFWMKYLSDLNSQLIFHFQSNKMFANKT